MSKTNVNKKDIYRVLLTDTLPFETPITFSNEGFYNTVKNTFSGMPLLLKNTLTTLGDENKETIPCIFKIKRTGLKVRTLCIAHPVKQISMCRFYAEYSDYILYLCNSSNFSLRKPSSIASVYYKKEPISIDAENEGCRTASTYFSYQRHRLIYQFYNSRKFVNLEKKYRYLRVFDITKCFNSIYTHSLCWAVKGKRMAKQDANTYNFENNFDKLMQKINNNETAGIIIGPEISRIFAEIILQSIDCEVEKILYKEGLIFSTNYEICRYVDDYFVFTNNLQDLDKIQKVFQDCLEPYRLYLNDSKNEDFISPFTSNISIAKEDLSYLFDDISNVLEVSGKNLSIGNNQFNSLTMVAKLKTAISRNNANVCSLSGYIFFRLKKTAKKLRDKQLYSQIDLAYKYLEDFLFICFYLYSMDVRITTTYSIANILVDVCDFANNNLDPVRIKNIQKLIFDEVHSILRVEIEQKENSLIEVVNLLVILRKISPDNKIPASFISKIFEKLKNSVFDFNYLSIMALLYICENDKEYASTKQSALNYIKQYLLSNQDKFNDSCFFMTFFDIIKCPYILYSYKEEILRSGLFLRSIYEPEIEQICKYINRNDWFTDWELKYDLSRKLQKREFVSPYE